ncbi:MAG: triose-phosphate isomerase [Candidatus Saccharimonadales bacterium]
MANDLRKPIVIGNWKMHLSVNQSRDLAEKLEDSLADLVERAEVVLCPSAIALHDVSSASPSLSIGVQNIYFADEGAYTGEISASQVKDLVQYAIIGHSERRHNFGETNEMVARKTAAALRSGITPIVCVGETAQERHHGETTQVINDQLSTGLTMITASEAKDIIIAYEPVWAIGTGENAKEDDVISAAATIRSTTAQMFGADATSGIRVIYGGSVNGDSAGSYLNIDSINGLLVGGASLNDHEFTKIVQTTNLLTDDGDEQ